MAGYELYSWQETGSWHFTLITGTDRNKNLQEIVSDPDFISEAGLVNIHCTGVDAIKTALGKVQADEWVTWSGGNFIEGNGTLSLPSQDVIDDIKAFALGRGLDFSVNE